MLQLDKNTISNQQKGDGGKGRRWESLEVCEAFSMNLSHQKSYPFDNLLFHARF